jgi:uncharacterized SAM-binding protein YcdF (DUF218 family)
MPLFWLLLVLSFVFHKKGKRKTAMALLGVAAFGLALVSNPVLPRFMARTLENQYEMFSTGTLNPGNKPVHILVLGGSFTNLDGFPATSQLDEAALARLVEGIRIHRQVQGSILITSADGGKENIPQAEVARKAAILLGVDSTRIKMQTTPKNTRMEAMEYMRIFGDTAQLVLVTSAIHMPRAMMLFHDAGLNPLPAPTHYLVKERKKRDFWYYVPNAQNIRVAEAAIHEYMGMLWHKMRGA